MKTHTLRFLTLLTTGCVGGILTLPNISAEQSQPFPTNWGEPPAIQTHDYVEWPGGYGHGSGTVAKWIAENLEKDKASLGSRNEVLYAADFSTVEVGKLPEDFLVLNGEFAVQADAGKKFIELPGTPIESFAVMFGPAEKENVSVSAKIRGTSRGRRYPAFALGINGLGGYRLNLIPA